MTVRTYPVELTAPDIEPYRKGNTGIEFVTTFDSGIAGPHVMINAVTHGNEICGAIALDKLFKAGVKPHRIGGGSGHGRRPFSSCAAPLRAGLSC